MNKYSKHEEICLRVIDLPKDNYTFERLYANWERLNQMVLHETPPSWRLIVRLMEDLARNCSELYIKESGSELDVGEIMADLHLLYQKKNKAYGNSFGKSVDVYGPVAMLIRMSDKIERIKSLRSGVRNDITDESLFDSILDLCNYMAMSVLEIETRSGISV